jgi:glycosyltransferase involved in cell wall biosynthesis
MFLKFLKNDRPAISVIVVMFNMVREAKRTLLSLSVPFQQGVSNNEYEVIVVDNGSTEPLSEELVRSFGENFSYYFLNTNSVSPAGAVNFGVSKARGTIVGLMIDGARMASPGVLKYALAGMKLYPNPIVATLAWHLGPDVQYRSISDGYDKTTEDALLESINWVQNGYGLFDVSSFAGSSENGFFLPIAESNCFFMKRKTFERLGGFDEHFQASGGGLVNLDTYKRACELPDSNLITILGEGTFHQVHGGVSTNVTEKENFKNWQLFETEYIEIRQSRYAVATKVPEYIGHAPPESLRFVQKSLQKAISKLPPD